MSARPRAPLVVVGALLAGGLVLAASVDRTPPVAVVGPAFGGGPVTAEIPRTEGWAAVADLGPDLSPASTNVCERGDADCLGLVLDEMEVRLDALGCAHTAPFAFTYLEMTRGVHDAVLRPGFFASPESAAHADALFARFYFDAIDNWTEGRTDEVPAVWRLAFGAADSGETDATTDLLLGINAHIARDLPYVVADIAEWQQEAGEAREEAAGPTDYERINEVIATVKGPMLQAAADRFDPTLALLDLPLPAMAATDSTELIGTWRNQALERGIRLSRATSDAERAAVEGEVERGAMATAVLLLNAGTTASSLLTPEARDTYCESQRR